ncbi:MAG TPA: MFS transporter [Rhodopila sp.]|nr:MFS transporter [Rhodopila sp.]
MTDGEARTAAAPRSRNLSRQTVSVRSVALIVASAMFMEQMDGTVLATALPTMARSLGTDPLHMNVALTSYLLSLAVFIPASGKVADRLGARNVFRAAIALFTLGSILCAQAPDLSFLVASRILQGIGGAMMVPVGRLVLLRTSSKSELVTAMAWLQIPSSIGPILGPPIGGFIVTYFDWRWIFYINVPIGILGIVLVTLYIEDVRATGRVRFDIIGMVLSGVALACLMWGIEMASRGFGSGRESLALLAVGAALAVLYRRHARRHPQPVLSFRLMRIPTFRISVLAGSCSRIAVGAIPFLLPMMLQLGFGLSALQSGLITFTSAAGSLAMKALAPHVLRRIGFRNTMVWIGLPATLLLASIAFFQPGWPLLVIYGLLLAGGFLQSLQFIAYNTIAYADVPPGQMSAANSFYTTFQQLTLSLGIAVSAASLAFSSRLHGHAGLQLGDFTCAFLVVAAVALVAPLLSLTMKPNAGDELSGHHASPAPQRLRS